MPQISIIVPVYNTEPYLRKCIDSIIAQTFTDFECILVDDGSPDNCPAICDEYAVKDSRFIVIHQKNKGVSAARNAGLDIAQGKWIGFVDSDDWCDPDMFRVLYENAMKYSADVSICGFMEITSDLKKMKYPKNKLQIVNGEKAILNMLSPPLKKLKKFFGGYSFNKLVNANLFFQNKLRYDSTIRYMEDVLLFYEVYKHSEKVVYYFVSYYNYFRSPESITLQYGLTEAAKTALVAFDKIIMLENDSPKIKKMATIKKITFSLFLCHQYIKQNDYSNENFLLLREYIVKKINYFILDSSISLKKKVLCCLLFYPNLYKKFLRVWNCNRYISHKIKKCL